MAKRIFLIKGKGTLVNVGRGLPSYDLETARKVVNTILSDSTIEHDVFTVRIPHLGSDTRPSSCVWKYDSHLIEFHVAKTRPAKSAFASCLRIADASLEDHHVLAVFGESGYHTYKLFNTVGEAFADDVPVSIEFIKKP